MLRSFFNEIQYASADATAPVVIRLAHLLLPEKSLRLFTLKSNKILISKIMEDGMLCLINLSVGIIGKQRSSILSGLMDSLINNNILLRANIPYHKRKPCTLIKDEFYLGPGDLDSQLTGLAKYGLSVVFANQYLDQVEGSTREVMATAGTRIAFKTRRKDAEIIAKDFGIEPEDLTSLLKFKAFVKIEDEVVKVNTPKPKFNSKDYTKDIMKNNMDKYYLMHTGNAQKEEKEKLEFDKL